MKAIDIKNHMQTIGTWVNWDKTCDRFITGDPETEVRGIAVAWQARTSALKQAVEMGCNLFITHEPVFYNHMDDDERLFAQPHCKEKGLYIEQNRLVIFRCHDVWDQMPVVGIVDRWGAQLGLSEKLNSDRFHSVYQSPVATLGELAKHVAEHTREIGQNAVQMVGEPDAPVNRVAIGCGAITRYETMTSLGADAIIGTDDGMNYWADGAWCLDRGIPLVIVNHCTAEEPGMKSLAQYVSEQFPGVPTHFIPQGCMYRTVV